MYTSLNPGAIGVSTDFTGAVTLAAKYGFEAVAIDPNDLLHQGAVAVGERLEQHGLRPGPFGLPVDVRGSQAAYEASLAQLPAVAKAAQQAGCHRASTYLYSWSDDKDYAANFAFHQQRLATPASMLADQGIRLGLEFLGPKTLRDGHPYAFIHTLEGMLELCAAFPSGNVGLLLDAWHWYTSGHDKGALARLTAEQVVDVHVNDAPTGIPADEQQDTTRCLPGETGVIDLNTFLTTLERMGYDGPVTVEPFSAKLRAMPAEEAVAATAASLRQVWQGAGLRAKV